MQAVTLGFQEFKGSGADETLWAGKIARRYGAEHHCQWITREDFQRDLPRILHGMDQPSTDGVNTYFVAKAAAAAGLKAALSGLGGDELLGGYPSFREVPRLAGALAWAAKFPRLGRAFRIMSAPLMQHLDLSQICRAAGVRRHLRRGLPAAPEPVHALGTAGGPGPGPGPGRLAGTATPGTPGGNGAGAEGKPSAGFRPGD